MSKVPLRGFTALCFIIVWFLRGPGNGQAQTETPVLPAQPAAKSLPAPPLPPTALEAQAPSLPPTTLGAQVPPATEPDPGAALFADGPPPGERTYLSFGGWATVPYPYSWPPLGWMFRRPTGPGYYSLSDLLTGNYRDKPPPYPWPPFGLDIVPMYDANFQYLDKPDNTERDWIFDHTKRLHPTDDWMFSIGGEERIRYENFPDYQLAGKDQVETLERQRVYGDIWYLDIFRIYVEYLDAQALNPELPPSATDVRRNDLLNAFADIKLAEIADNPLYFRIGRQELIYGSERLISSFDWANVLRNFEGVKTWYRSENLDVDAFYVQPIIPNADHGLSSVDDHQGFAGLWATYRPEKNQLIDLYVLNLEDSNPQTSSILAESGGRGGYNVTTFGARAFGEQQGDGLLWDFEPMLQVGQFTGEPMTAWAWAAGLGWHFPDLPADPSIWFYNETASGTHNPGTGEDHTFNQLFPFGHYYYGWLDTVGRQNIIDWNADLRFYPMDWITVMLEYHIMNLYSATDALYNATGTAFRRDPTGQSGTDVGDEIDFCINFHLSPHSDVLIGYSKLFAGNFIKQTGPGGSPEFTYVQYSFRW